jgi:hypothetical protein
MALDALQGKAGGLESRSPLLTLSPLRPDRGLSTPGERKF